MQDGIDIKTIQGILRRRKRIFLLTFLSLFLIGGLTAFLLPPVFLSKATILIEGQQIPQEYVRTTITSFVEERLQIITQRIMSRGKLMDIINRFDLYRDMKDRYTTEEILETMRKDIKFKTISAEVKDRRTGQASVATIAFTLSYEGKDPGTVQKVANVLTSLYLEENLKTREQRASNTTEFLQQELDQLRAQMDVLQGRISEFKTAHIGELPEFATVNLQAIERLLRDAEQTRMQIHALRERKTLLEGQIATVEPHTSILTPDGKVATSPSDRLKALRLQLVSLQAALSEKHPDVKRVKNEIQELEKQVGESAGGEEVLRRREELSARLSETRGRLGPKHPEVVKMTRELELLQAETVQPTDPGPGSKATAIAPSRRPDNPAYINLRTQIETTDLEIAALIEHETSLRKEMLRYEKKIESTPVVEKQYLSLLRDYDNAKAKYNELTSKYLEAKVALGMEETQRGERFTIIDPAQLPESPSKPNRLAIVVISLVLSLGAGVGAAAVREVLDKSIKTAEQIHQTVNLQVLSVIPLMVSPQERRARRIKWAAATLASIAVLGVAAILVDQFVIPLDVLWARLQRKVMKMGVL
ncbi:MAG: lipopolysaccharide biosynthesis protein [Rubrivivax sp.]|nr:lipopolysaccharide biosynthesis protein [Rubrivivax sp.]